MSRLLSGLCSWAGRFRSYLVRNPEDRFSHDDAQILWDTFDIGLDVSIFVTSNLVMKLFNLQQLNIFIINSLIEGGGN